MCGFKHHWGNRIVCVVADRTPEVSGSREGDAPLAPPLQSVEVSRKGRSHPKHKGREGGSFPVKIDKEIRIYAPQL